MRRVLAAALSLLMVLATTPAHAELPDGWYTRGRQLQRDARVEGDFGYLDPTEAFRLNVGLSASQPLNVDGKIYHMAGNALWEIDPIVASANSDLEDVPPTAAENGKPGYNPGARILIDGINDCVGDNGFNYCEYSNIRDLPYRPSSSGLTYRKIGSDRVLFFGTGNNQVCAFNMDRWDWKCAQLEGPEPVSSTPLVFETLTMTGPQDIVAIGDKAGNLWLIQNLSGPGDYVSRRVRMDGWVSTSPSWTGEETTIVVGSDGIGYANGNGRVAKYQITPYDSVLKRGLSATVVWDQIMPYGIAGGMAVDKTYTYVADVNGNMYRYRLDRGSYDTVPWSQAFPTKRGVFANQMASVDDNRVYFSIRYTDVSYPGAQPTGPNQSTGAVVAVKKSDWSVDWVARLDQTDGAAATALAWPGEHLVILGSMQGYLYGFHEEDGHDMRLAFRNNGTTCEPVVKVDLLNRSTEEPYRSTYTYQQLNGAGVEPSLARSGTNTGTGEPIAFLVTGANYQNTVTGEPGGRLVAFRTTGMFNTYFQEGRLSDENGQVLASRARAFLERYPEDKTFTAPAELELLNTYTVDAVLKQDGLDSARTFGLWWFWTNKDGTAVRLLGVDNVRAHPRDPTDENDNGFENGGKVSVSYTPQPGENGEGWIIGIVNPGEVFWLGNSETEEVFNLLYRETVRRGTPQAMFEYPPAWELAVDLNAALHYLMGLVHDGCFATYPETELKNGDPYLAAVDNFVRIPIRVSGSDLAIVDATAPPSVPWSEGGWYNVSFTVQNGTGMDVATDWTATLDGDVIAAGTRTWYVGTEGNTVTFTVPIDRGGRSYVVEIEVNPERSVLEDSYDNNTRIVVTVVGSEPAPPPPDTWDRDPTEEMLVPTDCSENSDPTAPEPCTDYPNLTAPWYCAYNPNAPECRGYTDDGVWYDIPPDDDR